MKRSVSCLALIFCLLNCFSQNRNNTWYFGTYTGLNFNTNPPTGLTDATFDAWEGCASMSDNSGNLLFFTNGISVWNRNHNIMPNGTGLKGEVSATQAVMIIPKPCDDNTYYIFTVPSMETSNDTLYYSILDISLNGGLGDITVKNIPLRGAIKEKLTGVIKSNGIDYWVMVKESNSDVFFSFSVTASGVNPVPVISHGGITIGNDYEIGYMQISPDNTKLCLAYYVNYTCELLDFDNVTGMVSNSFNLSVPKCYGVEFSPDNSKLYVSEAYAQRIHQFNLLAGTPGDIQNSDILVASLTFDVGALMLGPDNKIYVSALMQHYISVIDQPNQPGTACNFISQYVSLGPGTNGMYQGYFGLPNNLKHFSSCFQCQPTFNISNNATICAGQTYTLTSGTTVSVPGIYSDTIRNQAGTCDSIINSIHLFVDHVSLQNIEVHICPGQVYMLSSGTIVNTEGIYLDTLRSQAGCDSIIKTVNLFVDQVVLRNRDVHICAGQVFMLPSGIVVNVAGIYPDTLRSLASCDSIINTIHLFIDHVALLNTNTSICSNQTYQLPSGIIVNTMGTYVDTLKSQAFCDSIINTIHLVVNDISSSSHLDSIYEGQTYALPSGIIVSAAGTYQSTLINSQGCDSVITTVLKLKRSIAECITLKNAFTPNGDGINDHWVLYKYNCFKKLEVDVYNRYGSLVYHSNDYKNDWNGKYKNKELPDGTYYYVVKIISFDGKEHLFKDNVTILR